MPRQSSLRIPLRTAPTENLDVYQAYLRGLELRDYEDLLRKYSAR
jgi:hypothetical protein